MGLGGTMTVVPGRAEGQLAVMLTVGSVELAIHLPREVVEKALAPPAGGPPAARKSRP